MENKPQSSKPFLFSLDIAPGAIWQRHLYSSNAQKGDLYYGKDGVRFERMPIGTNGQVLAVSATGVPNWSPFVYAQYVSGVGGSLGINSVFPAVTLDLINNSGSDTVHLTDYSGFVLIIGEAANGSPSSATAVLADDSLMAIRGAGYNGSGFTFSKAQVNLNAAENWSSTNNGTYISFVTTKKTTTTRLERMRIDDAGNIIIGTAALATTATDGFLYIPTCAGTPTGVPTAYTGLAPMVYDTTGNKLWVYNGAWKGVALA